MWVRCLLMIVGAFFALVSFGKQPNILFIFTDDHACQSIGAYGSKINKTPNIDRLADEGAVFINSFCNNSICGPSRASVVTGKMSHKNHYYGNLGKASFDNTQFTFPQALQKGGYQTGVFGKWHLKSEPTGFDSWEVFPDQGSYYNPVFMTATSQTRYTGYSTTLVTDMSLKWLDERDEEKPFLLLCQYKAPHRTWAPDLKHLAKYEGVDIPEPATLFDDYSNRSKTLKKNRMSLDKYLYYSYDLRVRQKVPFASRWERRKKDYEYLRMNPEQQKAWDAVWIPRNNAFLEEAPTGKDLLRWKYQRYVKNYLRCIDSVDENVGRVLSYLDENGLKENTIVIYSSDQGFYLGEHGWYDKRWMFEESMKMPFLIRWPERINAGTRYEQLIQNIDYAPTFLDAAGLDIPEDVQGESLLPLFADVKAPWRDAVYYHYYEHGGEHGVPRHEGVRDERYKLINFYSDDGYNLFDLQTDPTEVSDLSRNPEYQAQFELMKGKLATLRKEYELE